MGKSAESQLSAGQSQECLTTAGRSKSTEPVRMVRGTPTLFSMGPLCVQLGRWGSRDLSRTPSQRKAARALEQLGLEILAKQAEARGAEQEDLESTRTRNKRKSSGKR